MEEVYNFGPKVKNILDIGKITIQVEKENYIIQTEIYMRENGNSISQMVMVYTQKKMDAYIKANGRMVNKMVTAKKLSQMVLNM